MKNETWAMLSRMLNERAEYYNKIRNIPVACAYESAFHMIDAAMNDDIETLRNYDYYGEDN